MRHRFLVIGCGSIGQRHIGNLVALDAGEVVAFDVREDRRRDVESRFGVDVVDSLKEAWHRAPGVALITVPTSAHVPLALEAAEHGCHLFIEKPLSDRVDAGLSRLLRVVDERRVVTLVGCNMRFHPGPMRVKALLDEGAVGRVLFARVFGGSYLPDWHPWEDYGGGYSANASMGGGCVLDGIHEIDLARWYVGEVGAVAALVSQISDLQLNVEDVASIVLQHIGGQHSEVHLDYVQRAPVRGCLIAGTDGSIAWEWADPRVRWYRADQERWVDEPLSPTWSVNQMYVDEMAHFLACIMSGDTTCNPVIEAAAVTRIALAARRSSQERSFVDLPGVRT